MEQDPKVRQGDVPNQRVSSTDEAGKGLADSGNVRKRDFLFRKKVRLFHPPELKVGCSDEAAAMCSDNHQLHIHSFLVTVDYQGSDSCNRRLSINKSTS